MDSSVSPEDEIWFLRVCHRISTGLYSVLNMHHATHLMPRIMTWFQNFWNIYGLLRDGGIELVFVVITYTSSTSSSRSGSAGTWLDYEKNLLLLRNENIHRHRNITDIYKIHPNLTRIVLVKSLFFSTSRKMQVLYSTSNYAANASFSILYNSLFINRRTIRRHKPNYR